MRAERSRLAAVLLVDSFATVYDVNRSGDEAREVQAQVEQRFGQLTRVCYPMLLAKSCNRLSNSSLKVKTNARLCLEIVTRSRAASPRRSVRAV